MKNQTENNRNVKNNFLTRDEMREYLSCAKTLADSKMVNDRNYCLLLMMYQHGSRVTETLELTWDMVDLRENVITIHRKKGSRITTQTISKQLSKALYRLRSYKLNSDYVFCKTNGDTLTRHAVNQLCISINKKLKLTKKVTPHTFKHSAGVALAKLGKNIREVQAHLGHRQVNNTLIYMDYSPNTSGKDLSV